MEEFETIEHPKNIRANLYLHQLHSVNMMEKLEREKCVTTNSIKIDTNIGINSDITGYGKTLAMVTLVLRDKMEWDMKTTYNFEKHSSYGNHHIKKIYFDVYEKINTTLVLAGNSIIHQWKDEFDKTDLKVFVVKNRKDMINVNAHEYDVLIVTPSMFNYIVIRYYTFAWKRFIFDEPSTTKVSGMKEIRAGFIWLITATPDDIYLNYRMTRKNFIGEIVGDRVFNYHIREIITVKNDDAFVVKSFLMPPTNSIYHKCRDNMFRAIHGMVNENVLRMIEAGHIFGAVQALGGKKTDNIIELVKNNKNIELEEIRSKIKIWKLRCDEEKTKKWTERELVVISQIKELEKRFENILNDGCSICYDTLKKPVMESNCQNIFCGSCLFEWLKSNGSCPLCRRIVEKNELVYIETEDSKKEITIEENKEKTKEDIIINIIKENKTNRTIIFSEYNDTFDTIRNVLNSNGIDFIEIRGTSEMRKKQLEKFQNGDATVAFLNSRTDSSGINMQETTDIILYHKMDENITKQIIGRANRIGRKNSLRVHYLLSV